MKYVLTLMMIFFSMDAYADYYDGNGLLSLANDESVAGKLMFRGYVAGVQDSLNTEYFCVPSNVKLSQSSEVVLAFIKSDPKRWHWAAKNLIIGALNDAFPCKQ